MTPEREAQERAEFAAWIRIHKPHWNIAWLPDSGRWDGVVAQLVYESWLARAELDQPVTGELLEEVMAHCVGLDAMCAKIEEVRHASP